MTGLTPFWRWPLLIGWAVAVFAIGCFGCALPLTETLGYEFSLLVSLVVALGTGHVAACSPHRVRNQLARFPGARLPAVVLYGRALGLGLVLAAVPLAIALANRVRVPPCNELEGLAFYALMPVCSAALAAAAGLFCGLAMPGNRSASVLWFIVFAASLALALASFHGTPAVYLFGPFFGYFPGVLYDELIHVEARLVSYRTLSLVQLAGLVAVANWLLDPTTLRLSPGRLWGRPRSGLIPLALIAVALAGHAAGPSLGHRTDRGQLEALLPHKVQIGRLDLHFPGGADRRLVQSLTDDAHFSLRQVERFLDSHGRERIAVFFFADVSQRAAAMGAAGTNVAKPWRREVYVTLAEPPHPVLRHELAHAVAAELGEGPFAVPGELGGLLPDPGRIEGLATAAQGPRGELTLHQWAAAMRRLELSVPLERIFGLGFLGLNAPAAYTAAGSFMAFIREHHGAEALRDVYRDGDWARATGKELAELEKRWLAHLGEIPLGEEDLAVARNRFDRPAVIHSVCVHEVARLRAEARRLAAAGDHAAALGLHDLAHERSGGSTATRLDIYYSAVDTADAREVRRRSRELLEDPAIDRVNRSAIAEILADLDVRGGDPALSRAAYADLALTAPSEADRRRFAVKAHLTTLPLEVTERLFDVLARRPGVRALSRVSAALTVAEGVRKAPQDPALAYLLARQHFLAHDHRTALIWLDQADALGLTGVSASLALEGMIMRARSLLAIGESGAARELFGKIAADQSLRLGVRARAEDWAERVEFQRARR